MCTFQMLQVLLFLYHFSKKDLCSPCSGTRAAGLEVFSQKDELMVSVAFLYKQEFGAGGSWKLLEFQFLLSLWSQLWISWGSVNPCILGTHMVHFYSKVLF